MPAVARAESGRSKASTLHLDVLWVSGTQACESTMAPRADQQEAGLEAKH